MASKTSLNILIFLVSCYSFTWQSHSQIKQADMLSQTQTMNDWEYLDSPNKIFRLKFFSPGGTDSRYLGIFYIIPPDASLFSDDTRAVWVANRNHPIPDASGKLMIDGNSTFKISYGGARTTEIVLHSVKETSNTSATYATLLDNGNLVLRQVYLDHSERRVWESFDYPTDTLLPGMKLGINLKTGQKWSLTSWISDSVPASGSFTIGGDPSGIMQLMIWWEGKLWWSSGIWQNGTFENSPPLMELSDVNIKFRYVSNDDEKYLIYSADGYVRFPKFCIRQSGIFTGRLDSEEVSACEISETPSAGCVKNLPDCRKDNFRFQGRQQYLLGNSHRFNDNYSLSLFDCKRKCMQECSCTAFASITENGTGCQIWGNGTGFTPAAHYTMIYFLVTERDAGKNTRKWIFIIMLVGGATILMSLFAFLCFWRWKRKLRGYKEKQRMLSELGVGAVFAKSTSKNRGPNLQVYSFETIIAATANFSKANKLGEGGFGPVYKAKLSDGKEVAIKRLSMSSGQGFIEFKNEILLIGRLQHNNLVRLLGCCIEKDEKILIYEYMPKKSLDFYLFDRCNVTLLEWHKRLNIVEGIAQGLLYLHKYSRLRIIHRDLKASNILLDDEWNPKISDFGLARMFEQHESEANTKRVVGTYGYMSPEYAMAGTFSIKSDVFSFGVLLLEIVSGKKNHSCYHLERPLNLIGWAWELWKQDRALEIIDPKIVESYQSDEVLRCIHVGLLCVQENPSDRPSMSDAVTMIKNGASLNSIPKQPAFYIQCSSTESSSNGSENRCSTNTVTISDMQPR